VTKALNRLVNDPAALPAAIAAAERMSAGISERKETHSGRSSIDAEPPAPTGGPAPPPAAADDDGGVGATLLAALGAGGPAAAADAMRGTLVLQVHLVMEFADKQTLSAAVIHGRFLLPSGKANVVRRGARRALLRSVPRPRPGRPPSD
jgi:hypothetical protein